MSDYIYYEKPNGTWKVPLERTQRLPNLYDGDIIRGNFEPDTLDYHINRTHIHQPQVLQDLGVTFDAGLAYFHGLQLPDSVTALVRILRKLDDNTLEGSDDGHEIVQLYPNFNHLPGGGRARIPKDELFASYIERTSYHTHLATALRCLVDFEFMTTDELPAVSVKALQSADPIPINPSENFFARYVLTRVE